MAVTDIPLFSMLRTRMHWHQERQRLLAENVSNADTPKFRPHDLAPPQFARRQAAVTPVALARTESAHIATSTTCPAGSRRPGSADTTCGRPAMRSTSKTR